MGGRVKILHVVDSLDTGGLEKGVARIIHALDPEKFQHTVCAVRGLGPLTSEVEADGAAVVCLNHSSGGYRFLAGDLGRVIRQVRPDVVHSRNWGTIEAVIAGRLARRAVVHSEHGFETHDGAEPRPKIWFRRLAYELAHRVFSVSSQLREIHSRRTGFSAKRMDVIYNGVDLTKFHAGHGVRERMRRQLGLGPEVFCIGAVGRLEPVKDHATLLRAAALLPASTEWRIVVAGEGIEMAALQAMANDHPALAGRVRFLGPVPNVAELLHAFDVYVLPSLSEGISNSLLEAMATRLPVVATAAGGNPEVIVDGTSGLLFAVRDERGLAAKLVQLRNDAVLSQSLAAAAESRARSSFSLEAMVSRYGQLYASLASSSFAS